MSSPTPPGAHESAPATYHDPIPASDSIPYPVLIGIIPDSAVRPIIPSGQCMPIHLVHDIRADILEDLFRPHGMTKLEPCLDPLGQSQCLDAYLATFPGFQAVEGAFAAWNEVRLDKKPFIAGVYMDDVVEDRKMMELLDCSEPEKAVIAKAVAGPPKRANVFEDWWYERIPENWAERQACIKLFNIS